MNPCDLQAPLFPEGSGTISKTKCPPKCTGRRSRVGVPLANAASTSTLTCKIEGAMHPRHMGGFFCSPYQRCQGVHLSYRWQYKYRLLDAAAATTLSVGCQARCSSFVLKSVVSGSNAAGGATPLAAERLAALLDSPNLLGVCCDEDRPFSVLDQRFCGDVLFCKQRTPMRARIP